MSRFDTLKTGGMLLSSLGKLASSVGGNDYMYTMKTDYFSKVDTGEPLLLVSVLSPDASMDLHYCTCWF